jgi:hypothetical protein
MVFYLQDVTDDLPLTSNQTLAVVAVRLVTAVRRKEIRMAE